MTGEMHENYKNFSFSKFTGISGLPGPGSTRLVPFLLSFKGSCNIISVNNMIFRNEIQSCSSRRIKLVSSSTRKITPTTIMEQTYSRHSFIVFV